MGYYCTVPQCTSLAGKTKNVKFHRFPRDVTMADKWNLILKRGKPYTKYSKVCSLHFTQSDYNVTTMGQWKTLSKDAIPSQNLPKLNADGTVMVIRKSRTIKYREPARREHSDKQEKWQLQTQHHHQTVAETVVNDSQDPNVTYRLQSLTSIQNITPKSKKQDAFMQTDPVQSEEDDTQPHNSYSEPSEKSYTSEPVEYPIQNQEFPKNYEVPKDYTKNDDDYIPRTNEEYNKEAEKYALGRKSHNGYEKPVIDGFQKGILDSYQKDVYTFEKNYRTEPYYQNGYQDSVEMLRNQQHNLQMLQEQHRVNENQNFFNENHIKQEIDLNGEEEKFIYDRSKGNEAKVYEGHMVQQQRLLEQLQHQVKQEPDAVTGCESVLQPQGSPYYPATTHNSVPGYYEALPRPGPELLIAKQNALAAHQQLWQNTMKRPFFYSDSPHYNGTQLLHRYEESISRILQ
ncbi:uncharacterized protein LOC128681746 isoform X2 [Plodia interpunctella]|uniref:uncharacterized protein LOC128681746 isoform X2 n=2 Tax=Plodia interpunctella TaxID=58824 RepID=UPI00236778F2|nr:uncharacterized protein LOC128681746 isoform X2 [Plodia interpunctella]